MALVKVTKANEKFCTRRGTLGITDRGEARNKLQMRAEKRMDRQRFYASQGDRKDGEMPQSRVNWSQSKLQPQAVQVQLKPRTVSPWLAVSLATRRCLLLPLTSPLLPGCKSPVTFNLRNTVPGKPNTRLPHLLLTPECRLHVSCFHSRMAIHLISEHFFLFTYF